MKKTRFEFLKMIAVVAFLAIAFVSVIRQSAATTPLSPPDSAALGADTSGEERVIGKYFDDFFAYQKEVGAVKKRQVVRNADLDPLQRKSDDLKNRLAEVQNAVREVVRKLKASNEWDDLDTKLLARVTDPARRAFYQDSSFKEDLEYGASNLTSHRDEISLPLDGLRKRVARTTVDSPAVFVMAAYQPPTPMFGVGLGCRIAKIRIKLIEKNGGSISGNAETCTAISCACQNKTPCAPYECPGGATQ